MNCAFVCTIRIKFLVIFGSKILMNRVVVIGGDHHNTLGVIRGLGEKGVSPDLILVTPSKMTFVDASKYIARQWKVKEDDDIIDLLLAQYKDEVEKTVVICCSDSSSGIIDENLDRLNSFFFLPGSNCQGRITKLMNKQEMANLANEVGLIIPNISHVSGFEQDLSKIQLPCIIKPLVSRFGNKSEIAICRSYGELQKYVASHDICNCQIQEYIEKDFEYQLIGCSAKNEVIIPGVSKILRPCKGSNTSFLHYSSIEEGFWEIEKCKEFVRRTGYHGLFSLEFLRDKNGKDYFMEINFRNDGNGICVTAAGISLPYIWYLDCIGRDYSQEMKETVKPVYIMPDMAELKLLLTGQISLSDYISDFRMTNRFMEYDKNDPKPFWRMIWAKMHLW